MQKNNKVLWGCSEQELLSEVSRVLDDLMPSHYLLSEMIHRQVQTGGKQIRLKLPLIVAKNTNNTLESVLPWRVACEILHNASLVFDDIQDKEVVRRGAPSAWKFYGVESSINSMTGKPLV